MTQAQTPNLIFSQHGWADTATLMRDLAAAVAPVGTVIIASDLGFMRTWHRMEPLIAQAEQEALNAFATYPTAQADVVGHSMGGLIWIELLTRHPEWLPHIRRLALLGSPVLGADLARMISLLSGNFSIASDLGRNRRNKASQIAQQIPTLVLAGDSDGGSDGTIPITSTDVPGARVIVLKGIAHADLRTSPRVHAYLRHFFAGLPIPALTDRLVEELHKVPGMTSAHLRDFLRATITLEFVDGTTLRSWKNPAGVDHVFVADARGHCVFGGFVGWIDAEGLALTIHGLKRQLAPYRIG
ncbi:MAG: alpha/beta hydrolase [Oscillochloris sp.]|nr:alpha/beta hydrolase [Oscillochloris sp.]